ELGQITRPIRERLETDAIYAVYLARQESDIAAYRRGEALPLPPDLDYPSVPGLSNELRQKLSLVRPGSLGQACRMEGMTPAAKTILAAHAKRFAARHASVSDEDAQPKR